MGHHKNITATRFPKQGLFLGKRVQVCFNYDPSRPFGGVMIRDDIEAPHESVIQLDNGRVVIGSECQYMLAGRALVEVIRRAKGRLKIRNS